MPSKRPFHQFSEHDSETWSLLYEKQLPHAQEYASRIWLEGLEKLELSADGIPDFNALDRRFQDLVDWELVSTPVQFSDGQEWFEHLAERKFLITEYIREREDLDYTPMPDIWHDAFGHLPLMANRRYADYVQEFAKYALQFSKEDRKSLGSLWWYTIEFGFMMEDGEMKAFGAGLMSSPGEIQHAYSDSVLKVPYSLEEFEKIDPSPRAMHHKLFVLESMEELEQSVVDWVNAHKSLMQEA